MFTFLPSLLKLAGCGSCGGFCGLGQIHDTFDIQVDIYNTVGYRCSGRVVICTQMVAVYALARRRNARAILTDRPEIESHFTMALCLASRLTASEYGMLALKEIMV